ncbi:MAG: four helix bundle protein [Aliifodinibius sp.]|nr:four helix bundle protein [Fodinibius sp.]NIV15042.1 four helix bundle protein [Fodinibius sp.]NIY28895.1 four helix bundle protein [Fodinibius sp.]
MITMCRRITDIQHLPAAGRGDKRRFFQYALSSAKETSLWLWRSRQRGLISENKYLEIRQELENLIPQTKDLSIVIRQLQYHKLRLREFQFSTRTSSISKSRYAFKFPP